MGRGLRCTLPRHQGRPAAFPEEIRNTAGWIWVEVILSWPALAMPLG
jgi:hypothetical protein